MKFNSLKIRNFGSIKEVELPLYDQGLTLLLGRNEDAPKADSNGSGKSLSLDAFTWALWGQTIRGFAADEVVHNKAAKDCKVQVLFEDSGHSYEVRRYRCNKEDKRYKPNDLVLLCDGRDVSGASVGATEEAVETLVGLDFVTFCAMMPGAGVAVATMTDSEVKGLLERLLRTEVLGKASEVARKRYRKVEKELLTATTSLRDLNTVILDLEERISDLREQDNDYSTSVDNKLLKVRTELNELRKRKAVLNATVSSWLAVADKHSYIENAIKQCSFAISALEDNLRDVDTSYKDKVTQEKIYASLEEGRRQKSVEALADIQSSENTCPVCSQEVGPDAQHKLEEHRACSQAAKDKHTQAIVALHSMCSRDKGLLCFSIEEQEAILEKDKKLLKELTEVWDKAEKAEVSLRLLSVTEDQLHKTEHELKFSVNPYKSLIKADEVKLKTRLKERDKKDSNILALQEKADILSFWVEGFSPSGIRSFMLEHVTPILNHYAKSYADLVTDGEMSVTFQTKDTLKNGKLKEKFNIQVSQKNGGTTYASNSSGERARANLIIALALGELATLRAEKSLPFRFLDEPFESIDEAGTEAIVILLNQQKEKYNTVYVITHQDSLQQMFQKKLTVVKKDGYSTLEV